MTTPLRERILKEKEIEHERIKSEIRKNDAEAKKMEAEAKHFNRSIIRNCIKYGIAGLISAFLLWGFALDAFKNFYDLTYYENNNLKIERKELQDKRLNLEKLNEILTNDFSYFSKHYNVAIESLESLELELNAYSTLFSIEKKDQSELINKSFNSCKKAQLNARKNIKKARKIENDMQKALEENRKSIAN
jgi:hypothetical protein